MGFTGPGILPLAPIPSGEGRLAILSPFTGAGLEGQRTEGVPGQPQAKHRQGRELQGRHTGFPRWLRARARCSLHNALTAISMLKSDRLQRVSSELCSLQSPCLCMSCPFFLDCSFSRPCQPQSHHTCKTMSPQRLSHPSSSPTIWQLPFPGGQLCARHVITPSHSSPRETSYSVLNASHPLLLLLLPFPLPATLFPLPFERNR